MPNGNENKKEEQRVQRLTPYYVSFLYSLVLSLADDYSILRIAVWNCRGLSYDATLGVLHEVDDIVYLLTLGQVLPYLLDAFRHESLGIKQTVCLMYHLYFFIAEAPAAQSDKVDATELGREFSGYDVWGDVLTEAGAALNHHVSAYMAELMTQHRAADNGIVVDNHLTGKFSGVAYDAAVAQHTVVGYMHALHQKVVAAHLGGSLGCRATGNGNILTNTIVVAYDACGLLARELKVLWLGAYAGSGEYLVAASDAGAYMHSDTVHEVIVVSNFGILVYVTERTDYIVVSELCLGVDICQRTYLIHILRN